MTAARMDNLDHLEEMANEVLSHGELFFMHKNVKYKVRKNECPLTGTSHTVSFKHADNTAGKHDFIELSDIFECIREMHANNTV